MKKNKSDFEKLLDKACNAYNEKENNLQKEKNKRKSKNEKNK